MLLFRNENNKINILKESPNFFQSLLFKTLRKRMILRNKKIYPQEYIGEEDLSAKQPSQEKNPQFPKTHVHKRWAFSFEAQEGQRPEEIGG
jgi:hypothetical protein